MKAPRILLLALLSLMSQLCFGYGEPFIMGQGRYLSVGEKRTFFQYLEKSREAAEKEKYDQEYEKYARYVDTPAKITLLQFTKFDPIVSKSLYEGNRAGYEIFMVCFGCKEGIPAERKAEREKSKAKFYDIWVLSGNFIILEKHPKSGDWRVLGSGGAE